VPKTCKKLLSLQYVYWVCFYKISQ
jgi:hypothetical protein